MPNLIRTLILAVALQSALLFGSLGSCSLKASLIASGVPLWAERFIRDSVGGPFKFIANRLFGVFPVTGRTPIEYLDLAGLYTYDFRGKKVLDVAGGKSRFAQMLNLIYGHTGTKATVLDLHANAPFLSGKTPRIKADAFEMPLADKEFDLTVSNWMFNYHLPVNFAPGEAGEQQRQNIRDLADELIRVTRDGGEVRLGFGMQFIRTAQKESLLYLQSVLENHPRVKDFRFVTHFPVGYSLRIELTGESEAAKPNYSVPNEPSHRRIQWRYGGFALMPTAATLTILGFGVYNRVYLPYRQEKEYEEFRDLDKAITRQLAITESVIRKKLPRFRVINLLAFTKGKEVKQARDSLRLLKELESFYERTDAKALKPLRFIWIGDKSQIEPDTLGDAVFLDSDSELDPKLLVR